MQANLLELLAPVEPPSGAVSGSETIRWRAACRPVLRLLRQGGEKKLRGSCLLQEYFDLAKAGGSPGAVRLLQEFDHSTTCSPAASAEKIKGKGKIATAAAASASTGDPAARRAELLTAYCDRLLAGSKERPSSAALGAYRRLVASITTEEFEAKVGPGVCGGCEGGGRGGCTGRQCYLGC